MKVWWKSSYNDVYFFYFYFYLHNLLIVANKKFYQKSNKANTIKIISHNKKRSGLTFPTPSYTSHPPTKQSARRVWSSCWSTGDKAAARWVPWRTTRRLALWTCCRNYGRWMCVDLSTLSFAFSVNGSKLRQEVRRNSALLYLYLRKKRKPTSYILALEVLRKPYQKNAQRYSLRYSEDRPCVFSLW